MVSNSQGMMDKSIVLFNGLHMPILGLGTWQAKSGVVEQSVTWALETGYRSIDTAFVYNNEEAIGSAIKKWVESGGKREDLFITTKLPNFGNRPSDVQKYLQQSLQRLGLDYIDLYLIHHPFGFLEHPTGTDPPALDLETDLLAVWKEMENAVKSGKAKCIGLSNCNAAQVEKIVSNSKIQPANLQVELHAYLQQPELVETCKKLNVSVTAFAPLGSPYAKNYFKDKYDFEANKVPYCLTDPKVLAIADKLGKTPAQILLRFLTQLGITAVSKSSSKERIAENYQSLDFKLDEDDIKSLKTLDRGEKGRIFDFLFYKGVETHPEYPLSKNRSDLIESSDLDLKY